MTVNPHALNQFVIYPYAYLLYRVGNKNMSQFYFFVTDSSLTFNTWYMFFEQVVGNDTPFNLLVVRDRAAQGSIEVIGRDRTPATRYSSKVPLGLDQLAGGKSASAEARIVNQMPGHSFQVQLSIKLKKGTRLLPNFAFSGEAPRDVLGIPKTGMVTVVNNGYDSKAISKRNWKPEATGFSSAIFPVASWWAQFK
jgi:hypothetical protein